MNKSEGHSLTHQPLELVKCMFESCFCQLLCDLEQVFELLELQVQENEDDLYIDNSYKEYR